MDDVVRLLIMARLLGILFRMDKGALAVLPL